MSTDVGLEILGAQEVECLHCRDVGKVADFCTWFQDRGGLKVVHCECPRCSGLFRRIVCA